MLQKLGPIGHGLLLGIELFLSLVEFSTRVLEILVSLRHKVGLGFIDRFLSRRISA